MEEKQQSFDGFAIVELFGHQRIAGRVSEARVGGSSFIRVDVPEVEGAQAFTKFFGGGAIYAITPTDEATAKAAARAIQARPVHVWMASFGRDALPEPEEDF